MGCNAKMTEQHVNKKDVGLSPESVKHIEELQKELEDVKPEEQIISSNKMSSGGLLKKIDNHKDRKVKLKDVYGMQVDTIISWNEIKDNFCDEVKSDVLASIKELMPHLKASHNWEKCELCKEYWNKTAKSDETISSFLVKHFIGGVE